MRNVALLGLGFGLLVAETALLHGVVLHPWWPSLLLPVVIYLGVSQDAELVRGALLSFVYGYLEDAFTGSPMGLQTFVLVATFMLARAVRFRLLLRGPIFQVLMTFVMTALAGGMTLALRAIFERSEPFPLTDARPSVEAVFAPALTTALAAPFMFYLTQRIESMTSRRRVDEAAV